MTKNGLKVFALSKFNSRFFLEKVKRNKVTQLVTNNQMKIYTFLQMLNVNYFQL